MKQLRPVEKTMLEWKGFFPQQEKKGGKSFALCICNFADMVG